LAIHLYKSDLPDGLTLGPVVAIDTETMGLDPRRDRLCLVQLSDGDGNAHLVQIAPGQTSAPNLCAMLADPAVLKLFHFGRFDIAVLHHCLRGHAPRRSVHQDRLQAGAHLHRPARAEVPAGRNCSKSTSRSSSRPRTGARKR
jgi:hypothetical protein